MATIEQLIQSAKSKEDVALLRKRLYGHVPKKIEENPISLIESQLQPKQKLLLERLDDNSIGKWIGFGGSRGGSKSGGLRRVMLIRRYKYPGSVGVLFRKTLDDLRDNHITPLWNEYPFLRKYYNVQSKTIKLPNGSLLLFVHEDNEKTFIETFQGKNYDDIFCDEATHLTEHQLVYMSTSCRTTRTDMKSRFVLSMNPGGLSHSFIKRIFIDKKYVQNEDKKDYSFIQAYGWDNVEWMRGALINDGLTAEDFYSWDDNKRFDYFVERSDYGADLNKLPDNDRKAHLFGDWFVFAGQFFSMFTQDNVIEGEILETPKQFNLQGAIDYGKRTVFEVAYNNYDGDIVFFAESYTDSGTPEERANKICDVLEEKQLHKLNIVCDTNMGYAVDVYPGYDKSIMSIFDEVFKKRMGDNAPELSIVSKKSPNQYNYRIACNEAFKGYLNTNRVKFYSDCKMAIQTIPELVYDEKDKNGMDFDSKVGIDDPYDACKYVFMSLYTPAEPKAPLPKWYSELNEPEKRQKGYMTV